MAFHLLSELIPLIFQHRIFKALLLLELFILNQSEERGILVCTARKEKKLKRLGHKYPSRNRKVPRANRQETEKSTRKGLRKQ
jgi:uncharacterized alpha-E superfamily protein